MAFTYRIIANPTGARPYRAAIDTPNSIEGPAFLAEVATASGKDTATIEAVLRGAFTVMSAHMSAAERIGNVLGLFRVFPVCGGSYPVPDPAASDVAKTVSFNITPTPEFIAALIAGLTMEKTGESGLVAPDIASVNAMPGGEANSFRPGQGLEIRGTHLRGRNAAIPTVQLINEGGGPAVSLLVLDSSDARLVCGIPTSGFDGSCTLQITAPYGTETRTGVYGTDLTKLT